MNVGFVGTGNMGRPMAANILKAGHQMTVYDLSAEATAPLERSGATRAAGLAELSRAVRVTMLSLPDARAVESALFGAAGRARPHGGRPTRRFLLRPLHGGARQHAEPRGPRRAARRATRRRAGERQRERRRGGDARGDDRRARGGREALSRASSALSGRISSSWARWGRAISSSSSTTTSRSRTRPRSARRWLSPIGSACRVRPWATWWARARAPASSSSGSWPRW